METIQCSLVRPVIGSRTGKSPHCISWSFYPISALWLEDETWILEGAHAPAARHGNSSVQGSVREVAFSWNAHLSPGQESSFLGVGSPGVAHPLPHSQEDCHGLGPSSDSFRETAFLLGGLNQNCSNFLSSCFPRKPLSSWLLFVRSWFLFGFELSWAISSLMKVLSEWKIYWVAGKLVCYFEVGAQCPTFLAAGRFSADGRNWQHCPGNNHRQQYFQKDGWVMKAFGYCSFK